MRVIFLGASEAVRDTTSIVFVRRAEPVLIRMIRERDAQRRGARP